jgi:hypothetical protein
VNLELRPILSTAPVQFTLILTSLLSIHTVQLMVSHRGDPHG